MKIVNLSIFSPCQAMTAAGVFNPSRSDEIEALQSFWLEPEPPTRAVLWSHAELMAFIAKSEGADHALVDVPSYFVEILSEALKDQGIVPVAPFYAYTGGVEQEFTGWILL